MLKVMTACLALATMSASAQTAPEKPQPAYAVTGNGIAYYNTPNRSHANIGQKEVKTLATATVNLAKPADVLVQFTSQVGNVDKTGCPCSVRASLVVDQGTPVVVKRVNLSGGTGEGADYVPDRQGLDGSFVFALPAGKHEISLIVQQQSGAAPTIQAFYANLQALVFSK